MGRSLVIAGLVLAGTPALAAQIPPAANLYTQQDSALHRVAKLERP